MGQHSNSYTRGVGTRPSQLVTADAGTYRKNGITLPGRYVGDAPLVDKLFDKRTANLPPQADPKASRHPVNTRAELRALRKFERQQRKS